MIELKKFLGFFLLPLIVFLIHLFLMFFTNIYWVLPWFDIPMHFVGGASVGFSFVLMINYLQKENWLRLNWIGKMVFVVSLVSLTAVLWELLEFSLTHITGVVLQGNLDDTMIDLFLGLIGGLLVSTINPK